MSKNKTWRISIDIDESVTATVEPVPAGTCPTDDGIVTCTIEQLNETVVNYITDHVDDANESVEEDDEEDEHIQTDDIEWRIDFIGLTDSERKYLLTNEKPGLMTMWEFDGEEVGKGTWDIYQARYGSGGF